MLLFFVLTTILFVTLSTYFAFKYERKVKDFNLQERDIQRRVYELTILNQITEKIGYSLDIESIAESIALTVEDLFELSTVSYAIRGKENTITIKSYLKENVTLSYTQAVSKIILDAMVGVDPKVAGSQVVDAPNKVIETNTENYFDAVPLSYFNVPLIVNNELLGMINISSRKKGVYQDADMSLIYKIINTAQKAIANLRDVLETEKGKLDSMILSLPTGAILFGFEKNEFDIAVINQSAKMFLNTSDDPNMADVLSHFPQDFKIAEYIKSAINEKKSLILNSVKINEKSFKLYITPIFRHNSQVIIGVSVLMRDLTLENKVEKIREDFTNRVVHELRSPLTAIKGAALLLQGGKIGEQDQAKMIEVIAESSKNMLSTVSDILDAGKIEEGKLELTVHKDDILSVVKEHLDIFSYVTREKGIKINLKASDQIPLFYFDGGRVGQVINNLVSNAIKFTKNGGVISIEIALKSDQIEVIVTDSGVGIPRDKIPFLFTKFGQISSDYKGGSSGLGLYICREIVEAHHGKIWIESEENVGTKVYFTLPIAAHIEEEKNIVSLAN